MLRIARACVELGHQVDIYTLSWQGPLPGQGIKAHVFKATGWLNHQRYRAFIEQAGPQIATGHYDLVLGFNRMPGLDVYFAADPCFVARAHLHRGKLYRWSGRYRFFCACEGAVFNPAAQCEILLLSLNEKSVFQHWYATPDAQFHLLPPYLSAERFRPEDPGAVRASVRTEFGFVAEDKLLLLVGSGFKTKGLDRAIMALQALPEALRRVTRLLAVGQDNATPFIRLAKKLGIADQVQVVSGRNDIPRLMQAADLLVHPAYRENTGLVLLESAACGLPVLASDVCGYAGHVRAGGFGELVASPFQQSAFNTTLASMLTSPQRSHWRERGIAYAEKIMAENDGRAEAMLLHTFACRHSREAP